MTKEELIKQFEKDNWSYDTDDIYRKKLLELSYSDLAIKLRQLSSEQAITVFGG